MVLFFALARLSWLNLVGWGVVAVVKDLPLEDIYPVIHSRTGFRVILDFYDVQITS